MSHHRRSGMFVIALALGGMLATGCSVVNKVKQEIHNVEGNKATVDSFTQHLQAGHDDAIRGDVRDLGRRTGDRRLRRRPRERRTGHP